MKWSWKIGEVAGIGVFVHATFLIVVGWIGMATWSRDGTLVAVVEAVAFILALFGCIVLHELGHALAARRYDIRTRDITLYPIGGLARLERMPDDPRQELLVALAGPAVNLVIAAALWFGLETTGLYDAEAAVSAMEAPFLQRLMYVNLFIMAFNLLPAFPMDGGRALRALLATRVDYVEATHVAATVGQAMALGFGLVGLLVNPFLIFIALFVWIGAAAESNMVEIRAAIAGLPVASAMLRDFETLQPSDRLSRAVEVTLQGSQKDFPVLDRGALVGLLTQERLLASLSERGPEALVGAVLETDAGVVDSHEMLEGALARFEGSSPKSVPVTHDGALVGVLTLDNIGELLRIQAARTAHESRGEGKRSGGFWRRGRDDAKS